MRQLTLIQAISETLQRIENLRNMDGNTTNAEFELSQLEKLLPSGSGIDSGTVIMDDSTPQHIRFYVEYRHCNDVGFYCGWSGHILTVTPQFGGINLDIETDYNNGEFGYCDEDTGEWEESDGEWEMDHTHDYLCDTYYHWLGEIVNHEYDHDENMVRYSLARYAKHSAE